MSKSIIDRILSGEFDDESEDLIATEDILADFAAEVQADLPEPPDVHSVLEQAVQYVEKPKQSKVRKVGNPPVDAIEDPKQAAIKDSPAPAVKRGRGAPFKLVESQDEVCRLYQEGVSAKTISEKFGVSVSCVINCLKRNSVTIRPKGRHRKSS